MPFYARQDVSKLNAAEVYTAMFGYTHVLLSPEEESHARNDKLKLTSVLYVAFVFFCETVNNPSAESMSMMMAGLILQLITVEKWDKVLECDKMVTWFNHLYSQRRPPIWKDAKRVAIALLSGNAKCLEDELMPHVTYYPGEVPTECKRKVIQDLLKMKYTCPPTPLMDRLFTKTSFQEKAYHNYESLSKDVTDQWHAAERVLMALTYTVFTFLHVSSLTTDSSKTAQEAAYIMIKTILKVYGTEGHARVMYLCNNNNSWTLMNWFASGRQPPTWELGEHASQLLFANNRRAVRAFVQRHERPDDISQYNARCLEKEPPDYVVTDIYVKLLTMREKYLEEVVNAKECPKTVRGFTYYCPDHFKRLHHRPGKEPMTPAKCYSSAKKPFAPCVDRYGAGPAV